MRKHQFRPRFEGLEDRLRAGGLLRRARRVQRRRRVLRRPVATLQHAAGRVAPGDTVVARAGDYTGFNLTRDGTASAPITFRAEPGARVTAPNSYTGRDGINLEGASWVVIEGFTVVNQSRAGIRSVTNDHVVIRGNTLDNNGVFGVITGFTDDALIENNVASRSGQQHGIYVSNSGDRPVIRSNTIWGNRQCGIHMNGDASMGGDGIISGAVVENNVIYDNGAGGGSAINGDGVRNSIFRNNLIYNTHASGISLYAIDGAGGSTGNLVVNNTVLVSATGRWAVNIQDGSTNNTVRNNVLYNYSSRGAIDVSADSLPGLVSDYNAVEDLFSRGGTFQSLAQWRSATGQDMNSITRHPRPVVREPVGG